MECPDLNCRSTLHLVRWNFGRSASGGHCPRLLHDISNVVVLLPAVYGCDNGHEILATNPCVLEQFREEEYIPFILFHRSGVTRQLARALIALCVEGLNFAAIERFIKTRRSEYLSSMQLKISCITEVADFPKIEPFFQLHPSNDLITNCFLQNFVENKHLYFQQMAALTTSDFLSVDHTFKVSANLGYLRPDGKWVSMYNSLFIVLNNIGQVIAWQLTQSTSIDETRDMLSCLVSRLKTTSSNLTTIYVDNCCTIRSKLQAQFGHNISVKLDTFHAVQRITRVLSKRHPLYSLILKDLKLLLRDPKDTGKERSLPTPPPEILASNGWIHSLQSGVMQKCKDHLY